MHAIHTLNGNEQKNPKLLAVRDIRKSHKNNSSVSCLRNANEYNMAT